jgi:hypothetical protein
MKKVPMAAEPMLGVEKGSSTVYRRRPSPPYAKVPQRSRLNSAGGRLSALASPSLLTIPRKYSAAEMIAMARAESNSFDGIPDIISP